MKLNEKLNLQIKGEGTPLIRYPGDKLWSGLSLPMMSHGYEVQMTPLQILTFYNAVANDGKMMRPRFVTEILRNGTVIKRFGPEVIINSIASRSTIRKAKKMMEGVVEHGTATNLNNQNYKIAGKTGTAQIAKGKSGYRQDAVNILPGLFCRLFSCRESSLLLYCCCQCSFKWSLLWQSGCRCGLQGDF